MAKVYYAEGKTDSELFQNIREARKKSKLTFIIVKCKGVARFRLDAFAAGANMLVNEGDATVDDVIEFIEEHQQKGNGKYHCPICGMKDLTEDSLHKHHPLYHSAEPRDNFKGPCPICKSKRFRNFSKHLHNKHGPVGEREPEVANFAAFAWVVVRNPNTGKFLISNEPAPIAGDKPNYWLPAGRVDVGETFIEAGVRETLEEAGVRVKVKGVLKFMLQENVVPRIVLYAEPIDLENCIPKSVVDWESCGSFWIDIPDLESLNKRLDFRSPDPWRLFPAVADGTAEIYDIENEAFESLEKMCSELTTMSQKHDDHYIPYVTPVWKRLIEYYPANAFNY